MPPDHIIELAILITDRMERFTESDKLQFAQAMMNCPCLCARTMKDVLWPRVVDQAIAGGIFKVKKS